MREPSASVPGRASTLYVSYDGILEPLGESQVLGYIERLTDQYVVTLMTFEKQADLEDLERVSAFERRLADRDIKWIRLRYHKRPALVSTAVDVAQGIWHGRRMAGGGVRIVHARGYVAGLVALVVARFSRAAFVFDMRGFWADEKVDGGHWSRDSVAYAVTKRCERLFFESAQAIVSLTQAGVDAFPRLGYDIPAGTIIEVIPTCADLERFRAGPKSARLLADLGLTGHCVIGVVGTMSNWYLRRPMLEVLAYLVRTVPEAKVLVVTREDSDKLRADARAVGLPEGSLVVTSADYAVMPDYMRLMDVSLFFIKVCFSKKGSCATKLGELLATGVPVVINDGVGDSGRVVRESGAGLVLSAASVEVMRECVPALRELLSDPRTPERCRNAASSHFDVEDGSRKYARLYERVLQARAPSLRCAEGEAI